MPNTPENPPPPLDTLPALPPAPATDPHKAVTLPAADPGALALTGSVGDYELLGEIERGGMGIVYRARERHSGRVVAFKVMLPAGSTSDLRRFHLEARATGELNHPGIVAIHAWGEHEGRPYYTMDFVPGVPLSRIIQKGALPCDRAVRYLLGIARAVGAAHALGIVHRDLKPGNVIIDLGDQPRVLDFGLAKRHRPDSATDSAGADAEAQPRTTAAPSQPSAPRTEIGAILGTPSYMAPEQVRADQEQVGPPADVHALGAIFYEMLTGRPPYQGATTYHTLIQVLEQDPAPVRKLASRVPAVLDEFCQRCLQKDADDRYQDANALADDLQRRWDQAVHAARFARLTLTAGLVLVLLVVLRFLFLGGPLAINLERLAWHASAGLPVSDLVRQSAPFLVRLLTLLVAVLAPYLVAVGLLVWLVAWLWNTSRPGLLVAVWTTLAVLVAILSFWPGCEFLREGPLFLAWLLAGGTLGALFVVCARRGHRRAADEQIQTRARAKTPYLQRLFAARVDTRPRQTGSAAGLADFEFGKALYRWDNHEVYWARQKSLDRPTLVWLVRAAPSAGPLGVVVRHPAVLGLHAVGSFPEGWFLVTEPVAASPLDALVQQSGMEPKEAAALAIQLARAVQAFHDQGVCHGRLTAQWVLVRGNLEPMLCPCGFPSQAPADRTQDVQALGRLLRSWLPQRPRGWQRYVLAPLYRSADAAASGACGRAADLVADLEKAARLAQLRWRDTWVSLLVLFLVMAPLLFPVVHGFLGRVGLLGAEDSATLDWQGSVAAGFRLLALAPAAVLLGYTGTRMVVRHRRAGDGAGRDTSWVSALWGEDQRLRFVLLGLFVLAAAILTWYVLPTGNWADQWRMVVLVVAEFGGCWALGVCLAALVTYMELLFRSIRR